MVFQIDGNRPGNLKEILRGHLSDEELKLLVRSYDVVGDLAIIIIAEGLEAREKLIGEAILAINKNVKVVLKRAGMYQGEFRLIPLEVIAGDNRKETECKENGVRLLLNPEIAYYSVRSSSERKRIAELVAPGENVLVMFSGVAPFPLVIAKNSKAKTIVGVEKNPDAHRYGVESLKLNRKLRNITLYCGDVDMVVPGLNQKFDRILMPLPKGAGAFLQTAVNHLTSPGILHYYSILDKADFEQAEKEVEQVCRECGRNLRSAEIVIAGHSGPGKYRISLDCVID